MSWTEQSKLVRDITKQLLQKFDQPGKIGATYQWCVKLVSLYPQLADHGETSGEKTVIKIYCKTKTIKKQTLRKQIRHRIRYVQKAGHISSAVDAPEAASSPVSDPLPWDNEDASQHVATGSNNVPAEAATEHQSSSSSSEDDQIAEIVKATKEQTGGFVVSEAVLKARLKRNFDAFDWAQTFSLRKSEMGKGWPILSLQMHWPYLFKPEGVIKKI